MASERERIEFLLERDGLPATRAWVERTRGLYREMLGGRAGLASVPEYRRLFEAAVREFDEWLAAQR
jgi:hypothetical protein